MSATSDKLTAKLEGASDSGKDDDRNKINSGTKKEWSVELKGVTADVEVDEKLAGMHIEKFTLKGRWTSRVRKDRYNMGAKTDKVWGDNKKPFGTFTLKCKAVDGGITADYIVEFDGHDDGPNNYGRTRAEGVLHNIVEAVHRG